MPSQLEVLMQLYMLNLLQQQQQQQQQQQHQHQHQQQEQVKGFDTTNVLSNFDGLRTAGIMAQSLAGANSNLTELQQIFMNNIPLNENTNIFNQFIPNFSSNFLQSSTVTSTPTSLVGESLTDLSPNDLSPKYASSSDSRITSPVSMAKTPNTTSTSSGAQISLDNSSKFQNWTNSYTFSSPIEKNANIEVSSLSPTDQDSNSQDSTKNDKTGLQSSSYLNNENDDDESNFSTSSMKDFPTTALENCFKPKVVIKSENSLTCYESTSKQTSEWGPPNSDIFGQEGNIQNLKKFTSYLECDNELCRQENLREHFHCFDTPCCGKILSKKEDIIRHLKWHKKRKESLNFGFLRFSSSDDCSTSFGAGCIYNWKQTHYHCVNENCVKVYVSTSDVQMHANFHRKNSEIFQEGFQRFRAIEDCKTDSCPFSGKKISHFHCRRDSCQHTFKHKADMEKHKTYHLKDQQLTQDGFKKIMKSESCPFESCRFSNVCNHIHCVRESCNYVLHSSSQLLSHKRKHERIDGENPYRTVKKNLNFSSEDETNEVLKKNQLSPSTPLTSLKTDSASFQFLSRKRGRPPKKIQLPSPQESKKIKLESSTDTVFSNTHSPMFPTIGGLQMPNTAPNFQLTHLMAMFQLNPLLYKNLYPGGRDPTQLAQNLLFPNICTMPNIQLPGKLNDCKSKSEKD